MYQAIPEPLPGDNNGYDAWLDYRPVTAPSRLAEYQAFGARISSSLPQPARDELLLALPRLVNQQPEVTENDKATLRAHRLGAGTLPSPESFQITATDGGILIEAESDAGFLYGTFRLLKELQLENELTNLSIESEPYYGIRMLNHWDDPKFDYTLGPFNVTRGFAGNSIFDWNDLQKNHRRYRDYCRLLASIGINAVCINNVNADPDLLETNYLPGIAALADRFRPYGIRLYLAVCFSAPMVTDGDIGEESYGLDYPFCMRNRKVRLNTLDTADPHEPRVQDWWRDKADEIYKLIPDFGGFVIKANSEGMPGPQDYGRTHADGANLLARALAPHDGVVFWRTFVYGGTRTDVPHTDPRGDGSCQPYLEFKPLDGQFDDNVILQTKNGPADFRADEPPSSLLGAVPQTRQAVEFMIAQEYLGHTTHVCYQGEHWRDILQFDTHQQGAGSTIAAVTAGRQGTYRAGAIVAVANFGDDANWFGHLLAGANCYAFGELAWNPARTSSEIAAEWTTRTFGTDKRVSKAVNRILNESYETFARYAAPLGLGYMHESAHHYEPMHEKLAERWWNRTGAGLDRTVETGSQYLGQFHPEAAAQFNDPATCPIRQILFFHHLPWDHQLPNGSPLAEFIASDRAGAIEVVREWLLAWRELQGQLDPQRWAHVYERLQRQYVHAGKWRDAGLMAMQRVGQYDGPIGE